MKQLQSIDNNIKNKNTTNQQSTATLLEQESRGKHIASTVYKKALLFCTFHFFNRSDDGNIGYRYQLCVTY